MLRGDNISTLQADPDNAGVVSIKLKPNAYVFGFFNTPL